MADCYEIERKFLVEFPNLDKLNVVKKLDIVQTYLNSYEDETQRRVRKIESDGSVVYTYTEKAFISAVTRKEMEYAIDENEYLRLLAQARQDCIPIIKTRYCFEYKNQLFELDTYPFSEELATLELELKSADQDILFPEDVFIIKEVTGDSAYSNAELASAGAFPE